MGKTTYIFTRSSLDDQWFEDYYANDAEITDLINYHINFYRSKPHCTLNIFSEDVTQALTGYASLDYPDEHEDFDSEIQADPKLTRLLELVRQYYSQSGRSMQIIVE